MLPKNEIICLGVAGLFMVETVDDINLAQALNSACEKKNKEPPLKVMVQVNTSNEESW